MKDYKYYSKLALQDLDMLEENIKLMFETDNEEQIYNTYKDAIFRIRALAQFNNYRVVANKISKNF